MNTNVNLRSDFQFTIFSKILYIPGHEGGDCTNILPPMGGIVYKCNTVKLFHSPLCPGGRGFN